MNPSETAALGERLEAVRGRLAGAARIAGRKPEDVRLIAVSKLHPVEAILAAYGFGQRVFGENYVQEALAKQEALPDLDVEWHCIGHVQTNKAKDVTGRFALIHTVDNLKFAETLARRLPEDIPVQRVLLQVNIGNEPQKAGVDEHDLPALAEAVLALPRLEVRGLMCLPPFFDDGEAARPYFARLRELRDDLEARLGIKLPTSRKSLKRTGEERAALADWRRKGKRGGAPPFYRKFPLPPPTLFSLSYDFTGRGPKMSVPTRTRVAPSSTACTQSPDMPMESSGSLMPRRASRSSRSSRSRAK